MEVKERLSKVIKDSGLSLARFSTRMGVPRSTLRRYVESRTAPPTDFLEQVCKEYKISRKWLILGEGHQSDLEFDSPATGTAVFALFLLQESLQSFRALPPDEQEDLMKFLLGLSLNFSKFSPGQWEVLRPVLNSLVDRFPISPQSPEKKDQESS